MEQWLLFAILAILFSIWAIRKLQDEEVDTGYLISVVAVLLLVVTAFGSLTIIDTVPHEELSDFQCYQAQPNQTFCTNYTYFTNHTYSTDVVHQNTTIFGIFGFLALLLGGATLLHALRGMEGE